MVGHGFDLILFKLFRLFSSIKHQVKMSKVTTVIRVKPLKISNTNKNIEINENVSDIFITFYHFNSYFLLLLLVNFNFLS